MVRRAAALLVAGLLAAGCGGSSPAVTNPLSGFHLAAAPGPIPSGARLSYAFNGLSTFHVRQCDALWSYVDGHPGSVLLPLISARKLSRLLATGNRLSRIHDPQASFRSTANALDAYLGACAALFEST